MLDFSPQFIRTKFLVGNMHTMSNSPSGVIGPFDNLITSFSTSRRLVNSPSDYVINQIKSNLNPSKLQFFLNQSAKLAQTPVYKDISNIDSGKLIQIKQSFDGVVIAKLIFIFIILKVKGFANLVLISDTILSNLGWDMDSQYYIHVIYWVLFIFVI